MRLLASLLLLLVASLSHAADIPLSNCKNALQHADANHDAQLERDEFDALVATLSADAPGLHAIEYESTELATLFAEMTATSSTSTSSIAIAGLYQDPPTVLHEAEWLHICQEVAAATKASIADAASSKITQSGPFVGESISVRQGDTTNATAATTATTEDAAATNANVTAATTDTMPAVPDATTTNVTDTPEDNAVESTKPKMSVDSAFVIASSTGVTAESISVEDTQLLRDLYCGYIQDAAIQVGGAMALTKRGATRRRQLRQRRRQLQGEDLMDAFFVVADTCQILQLETVSCDIGGEGEDMAADVDGNATRRGLQVDTTQVDAIIEETVALTTNGTDGETTVVVGDLTTCMKVTGTYGVTATSLDDANVDPVYAALVKQMQDLLDPILSQSFDGTAFAFQEAVEPAQGEHAEEVHVEDPNGMRPPGTYPPSDTYQLEGSFLLKGPLSAGELMNGDLNEFLTLYLQELFKEEIVVDEWEIEDSSSEIDMEPEMEGGEMIVGDGSNVTVVAAVVVDNGNGTVAAAVVVADGNDTDVAAVEAAVSKKGGNNRFLQDIEEPARFNPQTIQIYNMDASAECSELGDLSEAMTLTPGARKLQDLLEDALGDAGTTAGDAAQELGQVLTNATQEVAEVLVNATQELSEAVANITGGSEGSLDDCSKVSFRTTVKIGPNMVMDDVIDRVNAMVADSKPVIIGDNTFAGFEIVTYYPVGNQLTDAVSVDPPQITQWQQPVHVDSAMIISNPDGMTAAQLAQDDGQVEILQEAYSKFAETVGFSLGAATQRLRRRRRLLVTYQTDSAEVYKFEDTPCPDDAPAAATCLTIFGRYTILVEDEEDVQAIYDTYRNKTQEAITKGALEETLKQLYPDSTVTVIGASDEVDEEHVAIPPTVPPTGTKPPETPRPTSTDAPEIDFSNSDIQSTSPPRPTAPPAPTTSQPAESTSAAYSIRLGGSICMGLLSLVLL